MKPTHSNQTGEPGSPKFSVAKRLSLYTVFSGLAALVNFASRFGYDLLLTGVLERSVSYFVSVTLAYLTGMVVNFGLSKYITFQAKSSGRTRRELIKFLTIGLLGLLTTVAGSFLGYGIGQHLAPLLQAAPVSLAVSDEALRTLGHLFGMGLGLIVNFVGHDRVSFRSTGLWDRIVLALQKQSRD